MVSSSPKFLIITEGTQGIGLSIVKKFLQENWRIINLSAKEIQQRKVINYPVNFTSPGWEIPVLSQIIEKIQLAKEICLIHNASREIANGTAPIDAVEFRKTAEVNIITPLILNNALVPFMPENSSILYLESILPSKEAPNAAACIISKHALIEMMRSTCEDLRKRGIHTACICKGFKKDIQPFKTKLPGAFEKVHEIKENLQKGQPLKMEELADLVWYCHTHPTVDGGIWHATVDMIEHDGLN